MDLPMLCTGIAISVYRITLLEANKMFEDLYCSFDVYSIVAIFTASLHVRLYFTRDLLHLRIYD